MLQTTKDLDSTKETLPVDRGHLLTCSPWAPPAWDIHSRQTGIKRRKEEGAVGWWEAQWCVNCKV